MNRLHSIGKFAFGVLLLSGLMLRADVLRAENPWEAKAKTEKGDIVWYTSLNVTTSRPIADLFQKRYPFLKVSVYRSSAERILNKVLTEEKAGGSSFDVVSSQASFYFKKIGLLSPYASPEMAHYTEGLVDPEKYWTSFFSNRFAIGFNTELVPKEHAPRDWPDLLHPRWRGKIGIDTEEFLWYGAMVKYMGEEKGRSFMKRLARQDIQWRKGHTLIAQMMAVGEFPVAIIYTHRIDDMSSKGAPVTWVRSADPIVMGVSGIGVSAKSRAPASSRLFVDLALSHEAQSMIVKSGRNSGRKDLQGNDVGLKAFAIPEEVLTNVNRYAEQFNKLFHSGS
jgi:iron(III) transport system substrate-binding protein